MEASEITKTQQKRILFLNFTKTHIAYQKTIFAIFMHVERLVRCVNSENKFGQRNVDN